MVSMEPTNLVLNEEGIISEDLRMFLANPPEGVKLEGSQFVVISIDWNYYGKKIHSINSITASFLNFDANGNLDLASLVIGTTKSDVLLPVQKVAVRDWIWEYVKKIDDGSIGIWQRTFSHVKQVLR